MKELVFLLKEESAKAMLETLLPRLLSQEINPRFLIFEGKQDLKKQMMKRMNGYINTQFRFIVMLDQDSAPDCSVIKHNLLEQCKKAGRRDAALVRIVCRELESFYLADLEAVGIALNLRGLEKQQNISKFRNPDTLQHPSKHLLALTKDTYRKVESSREIGRYLNENNQRSCSFKNLIAGIKRMELELLESAA